jgi:long-chain acyl-CoA synthetase
MDSDGQIKIIDRKKDLCKLQVGEYVSLGKVESVLNSCPVVENVCIYGDSLKSFCVALVSPNPKSLAELAKKYNKEELEYEQICKDMDITGAVLREIVNHSRKLKLEKFEIPGAVTIVKEVWTPDNGFLTSAMKIKRKPIQDFYQSDINRMYGI